MRRIIYLLPALCILAPVNATHAAAPAPDINCKSARPPSVPLKTYFEACDSQAAAARSRSGQLAPSTTTVYQDRTSVAARTFTGVPTWSDADILAQFPLTRDKRYMTVSSNPSFQRRISWMYALDGCFSRAEQVDVQAANAGKVRPYKLFAFGSLHVSTSNDPNGFVDWGWHTVPVVKNSAGEPIVFDAALSPCRPLPWKEWLALMVNDLAAFDDFNGGWGVGLGDSNAYLTNSPTSGGPSHSAESLSDQQNFFLPAEWDNLVAMGRDPNVELGSTPPWSGYSCLKPKMVASPLTNVAPGVNATVTVTCPYATLAVGGGFSYGGPNFATSKDARSGNGWQIIAKNTSGTTQPMVASAVCLIGAPSNASVSSIQGNVVNVTNNSNGTSTAACPSGQLIGGGYTTTLSGNSVMRIYNDNRTSSTGSTWQASAQNNTGSSKSVTSFAYCLQNTNYTFSQASGTLQSDGSAGVSCGTNGPSLGGGFAFPRQTAYKVWTNQLLRQSAWWVQMDPPPPNGDANAKSYVECLSHP